jgi:integrase
MVYKRGKVWWFEFIFNGQRIRESAKTSSKRVAEEAERARRRDLELGVNGIRKRAIVLFSVAAEDWLASKTGLSRFSELHYRQYVNLLSERFGRRLVSDINADDISSLQAIRKREGKSGRTINAEVGALRQILKRHGVWATISADVSLHRENRDVGKAFSHEDEERLLDALRKSRSPALLPLVVLSIDTGLRPSETRRLLNRNLQLSWRNGFLESGEIVVAASKTESGTGRIVPLTRRACAALTLWLSKFPGARPDSFVFPRHRVGFAGYKRSPFLYDLDLTRPMGEWKTAWKAALKTAGLSYRFYDLRHSFVTRLAENPAVSEQTITALAGHVSKRMLEHYSHIRVTAKRAAIAALETRNEMQSPQNPPQAVDDLDSGQGEDRRSF